METQILIQFPDSFNELLFKEEEINPTFLLKSSFEWKETKLYFLYENKQFETKLFDLPTIIESYKRATTSELEKIKKIYKTNNISQILRVFDENEIKNENIFNEISEKIINSGITPPTQWIKPNMFLKKKKLSKNERLLNEIIERDQLADFVEFELKNLDDEVVESDFIKEIETELIKNDSNQSLRIETTSLDLKREELIKQINELESLIIEAPNLIIKNRFKSSLKNLKKQLNEINNK